MNWNEEPDKRCWLGVADLLCLDRALGVGAMRNWKKRQPAWETMDGGYVTHKAGQASDYQEISWEEYQRSLKQEAGEKEKDTTDMEHELSEGNPWKNQRLPLGEYRHPTAALPEPPQLGDFANNERKFEDALADWWAKINGLQRDSIRTVKQGTPQEHTVTRIQLHRSESESERDAELARQRSLRVRNGTATFAERKAEAAINRTPDGRKLADAKAADERLSAAIVRAWDALPDLSDAEWEKQFSGK